MPSLPRFSGRKKITRVSELDYRLQPDEIRAILESVRCSACGHLRVFHVNWYGEDACNLPSCRCWNGQVRTPEGEKA